MLGGSAAIEKAATMAGKTITVPFTPGRTDALLEQTDVESFSVLEPIGDAFRNYVRKGFEKRTTELLIDKADLLKLTAPEMTVLLGGLRALDINFDHGKHGVLHHESGDAEQRLLRQPARHAHQWQPSGNDANVFEGRDRKTGALKWTATVVDLVFGSNSQLRALAEVYASSDGAIVFVHDFVQAWNKVMNLDHFDLKRPS